jgi:cytochrome c peroxidase
VPSDPTNRHADDPRAATLGQKIFFDTRFSGPLLDDANNGLSGTLGVVGETGKVACASCHVPSTGAFADTRSPRQQLSFASGWTHRKAPSLLDVAQATFLTWDGRRDTAFSQPFGPIESPLEFNSSRLFVAQQVLRLYRGEYEAIFGPPPDISRFEELSPDRAGCTQMPEDPVHEACEIAGSDDEAVTRIVTNVGKAIQAYTRKLACGRSRFDEWMDGDETALSADEQAGALLFVTKGSCDACHSGPHLTNHRFYNLGVPGGIVPFTGVNTENDPGAGAVMGGVPNDWLNSRGPFSDGDDGRLDTIEDDTESLLGAFRTPTLRCVSRRPSFMHNAEFRSLEDVIEFFSEGGGHVGYAGTSENYARNFTLEEKAALAAFLRALDGTGPDPELLEPPTLP